MKPVLLLAALLALLASQSLAQDQPIACGTPSPTSAQYRQLVRSVKSRAGARTAVGPLVYLPVKFHLVRRSDGSGNETDLSDINRAMYWLNEQMAPANLQFYLSASGIDYIHDSDDYTDLSRQTGTYAEKKGVRTAINVFVFNDLNGGWAGYAYYPALSQFTNCIFLRTSSLRYQSNLLPHEMGHYFNLLHTHEGNSRGPDAERTDGVNCQTAGDLVCDTPADPYGLAGASNTQCTYTGTTLDATGRAYRPDLRNLMGYWHISGCYTDQFTAHQHERLYDGYRMRLGSTEYNFGERASELPAPSVRLERTNASTATLRWNGVNGAAGYFVERADAPGGPWRVIQGLAPHVTQHVDGGRSADRRQYYRVRASNALNYSLVLEWGALKTQQIAFEGLPAQVYGAGPVALRASSSAGLPVQFRVKTGPGELLAGNQLKINGAGIIRVEAHQPGTSDYAEATAEQACTVDRAPQKITIESVVEKTFGDGEFDLSARSDRDLPLQFAVAAGPGVVSGRRVRLTGAGTLRIRAFQNGTSNHHPAEAFLNIPIQKAPQRLEFEAIPDKIFGNAPVELGARSSAGLPVQFSVEGPASVSDQRLRLTGAGTVRVTARQPGTDDYHPAADVTRTFQVAKAAQTLTFEPLPDRVYGQPAFALTARSSAGLRPTYGVTGPGQLTPDDQLQVTGVGTIVVTAAQGGDPNVLPAEPLTRTFRVEKARQQIAFGILPGRTYGDAPIPLAASVNSALSVQFSVLGPARLEGTRLTLTGAGDVTVIAAQPGDDNHHAAASVTQRFPVDKRRQFLTFPVLADRVYSPDLLGLDATSNSGRSVGYAVSGPAQLEGTDRLRLLRAGTVTVKVGQGEDHNHYAADTITRTFRVGRAPQTIATLLPDLTVGPLPHDLPADARPGLPLTYALTDGPATLTGVRLTFSDYGRVTLTLNQAGDDRYQPAPEVRRSFCANPAVPTVRLDPRNELVLISSSPFRNQWFLQGDTLRGATDARYAITRAGTYTVGVANPVPECASRVRSEPREIVISAVGEAVVAGFEVFPNPTSEIVRVTVRTSGNGAVPTLWLHDATGRSFSRHSLRVTAPGTYETELSVQRLSAGVYFLRVDGGGPGLTKRLVVR